MKKPARKRAPSPVNPVDSATKQEVCHEGSPTRPRWGAYHLAPAGASLGQKGVQYPRPETSNLKPSWLIKTHN